MLTALIALSISNLILLYLFVWMIQESIKKIREKIPDWPKNNKINNINNTKG